MGSGSEDEGLYQEDRYNRHVIASLDVNLNSAICFFTELGDDTILSMLHGKKQETLTIIVLKLKGLLNT